MGCVRGLGFESTLVSSSENIFVQYCHYKSCFNNQLLYSEVLWALHVASGVNQYQVGKEIQYMPYSLNQYQVIGVNQY